MDEIIFQARWPWITGDLQTVRNNLPGRLPGIPPDSGRRFEIPLHDGSGDRLAARYHKGRHRNAPIVILIHGLTGCENSRHVLQGTQAWLDTGVAVVRLNLRGSPPGRSIARSHYHMNRVNDLADACAALAGFETEAGNRDLVIVGFSFGGALAIRLACSSLPLASLRAVVAVSPPLDLVASSNRLARNRNRFYERWLLSHLVRETAPLLKRAPPSVRDRVASARHIRDFDDAITCREAGFRDALDYYRSCAPVREIDRLRVSTLVIHADDDPWVPPPPHMDHSLLTTTITRGGGHVGFHGRNDRMPWHHHAAIDFVRKLTGNAIGSNPEAAQTPATSVRRPPNRQPLTGADSGW